MKIERLNENMPNLDRVIHDSDLSAVTQMTPPMADAYKDSVEADKAVEDIIKPAEEVVKEKPFLGAEKQPEPDEPEEPKITLDESLFDEDSLDSKIYDFLDRVVRDEDYEGMIERVSNRFEMSPDEAEDYVKSYIYDIESEEASWHDTADQEEPEDDIASEDMYNFINSIEVEDELEEACNQDELNEDGRSGSLLRQYDDTDIEEEELDLWTQVYSSLINKPDEATWKTMHKKDTVILPKKMRYDTINSDADGNIIVYGSTEKDLDGARTVANYYDLQYEVKPTRDSWQRKHPEQSFSLTIKIPEDKVTDIDKYFKEDD